MLPTLTFYALFTLLPPASASNADSVLPNNASLLWGPYRPNLYLGIRPQMPQSLLMGLMWRQLGGSEQDLRHTCDESDDIIASYTAYDARYGGTQTIKDLGNKIDITTEFVKPHTGQTEGWAFRVKGTPRHNAGSGLKTTFAFYVGMEAMEKCAACKLEAAALVNGTGDDLYVESVDIHTEHPQLGVAELRIPKPRGVGRAGAHLDTAVKSVQVSEEKLWQTKSLFLDLLKGSRDQVLSNKPGLGNMHIVQFTFRDSFEFDILYSNKPSTAVVTSTDLTSELKSNLQSLRTQYARVFSPNAPFDTDVHIDFSLSVFSNLQAGLGYFRGDSIVDASHSVGYEETTALFWKEAEKSKERATPEIKGPQQLFTYTPSRFVYPRGFLWHEGFHLLLVIEWDVDLALDVLRSWLLLMNDDGWIAPEQMLDPETRNKVPPGSQVQYPHIASPPTLFWIISKFVDMLQGKAEYFGHTSAYLSIPAAGRAFIAEIYPKLKLHYQWWRSTQAGDVEAHRRRKSDPEEGYRWRGRTPQTNYASGLDDYPRAEPPDISELQVDALCWVGVMAQTLEKLALFTEQEHDIVTFHGQLAKIRQNLEAVHYSEVHQMYCDTRMYDGKHTFTCPKGYVALFPFITGFLGPEHPHLNTTLDLIADPDHLWTDYGIRSLSPESTRYGVGDNMWRSPIWININYLIIERLLELAQRPGPSQERCREMYVALRHNVVNMVYKSWNDTGYVWQQYNPYGQGQGTRSFTGWSALVVKIMAFPDLDNGKGIKGKLNWVVKEARGNEGWNAGAVAFAVMVMLFIYVTRRRFAGTIRSMKRKV